MDLEFENLKMGDYESGDRPEQTERGRDGFGILKGEDMEAGINPNARCENEFVWEFGFLKKQMQ